MAKLITKLLNFRYLLIFAGSALVVAPVSAQDKLKAQDVKLTVVFSKQPIALHCIGIKGTVISLCTSNEKDPEPVQGILLWHENFIAPFFPLLGRKHPLLSTTITITDYAGKHLKINDIFNFSHKDYYLEFPTDVFLEQLKLAATEICLHDMAPDQMALLINALTMVSSHNRVVTDITESRLRLRDRKDSAQQFNYRHGMLVSRLDLKRESQELWHPSSQIQDLGAFMQWQQCQPGKAVTMEESCALVAEIEKLDIDFSINARSLENCAFRTHVICDWLARKGLRTGKIWAKGIIKPLSAAQLNWGFHVAAIIFVDESDPMTFRIIDPLLQKGAVLTDTEWFDYLKIVSPKLVAYPLPAKSDYVEDFVYCLSSHIPLYPYVGQLQDDYGATLKESEIHCKTFDCKN